MSAINFDMETRIFLVYFDFLPPGGRPYLVKDSTECFFDVVPYISPAGGIKIKGMVCTLIPACLFFFFFIKRGRHRDEE